MTTNQPKRLAGILQGTYSCTNCNQPSAAAVQGPAGYEPMCEKHGKAAERQGLHVVWKLPSGQQPKD